MKVIFLDFDGVLNSMDTMPRQRRGLVPNASVDGGIIGIDPAHVAHLNEIVSRSGAVVVVSSTWRLMHPLGELAKLLREAGFEGRVVGRTRREQRAPASGIYVGERRSQQINDWLEGEDGVTHFLILDDDADAEIGGHFVRTQTSAGLTAAHVEPALRILGCES